MLQPQRNLVAINKAAVLFEIFYAHLPILRFFRYFNIFAVVCFFFHIIKYLKINSPFDLSFLI